MRRKNFCFFFVICASLVLLSSLAISADSSTESTQQPPGTVELSHVRVVRLSFVEGKVTVRRPDSAAWEEALLNMPIEEGFSLATAEKSFAEVEFENGSTVRLGQGAKLVFTQLVLTPQGGRINQMTLDQGYATVHAIPERHDQYTLTAADVTIEPRGKAEFRADVSQDRLRVEVFDGHVQASGSSQIENLGKNHILVQDQSSGSSFQITDNIQKDDWDKWTNARDQQSALAVNEEAVGMSQPIAGWDDLDVYGEWSYFPGYGNGWAPYESAGWSPYSAGAWGWYPNMGYTWVSAEPWGWLPFHYGYWNFAPGMGWFWMPGSFAGWSPALVNWYSGPGWIGWTPIGEAGVGGRAPCTLAVAGCLTAMPPNSFANREPVQPTNPHVLHPTSISGVTPITGPARPLAPVRATAPALASFSAGRGPQQTGMAPRAPSGSSAFARGPEAAPSSVIMGKTVSTEAFVGHHSALGSVFSGRQPVRVRMGSTIGGRFPMQGEAGLSGRGMSNQSGHVFMRGGPQILSRGYGGGSSGGRVSWAGMARGGGAASVSGGGSHSSGGSSGSSGSSGGSSGGGHH
jgi:hypothetical protein